MEACCTTRQQSAILQVEGITCPSCASQVEKALATVDGVQSAVVDLAHKQATVIYDAEKTHPDTLASVVSDAGYPSHILTGDGHRQHLVIIGGGSAAFSAALKANELGATVTLINDGLPIGGTCVNVGCVPSKTLIRAAEAHYRANHHHFQGIEGTSRVTDFKSIIQQKTELVENLRQAKYTDVVSDLPNFRYITGTGKFISSDTVEVNGERVKADKVLIATGAAPSIPPIPGLETCNYLTNETAFELNELPESLIVLGGRYVALELAQMFARLGTKVTVLQRSSRILPSETADLTDELTRYLQDEGIQVVTGATLTHAQSSNGLITITARVNHEETTFAASHLLVATGRRPNTTGLGLENAGVDLDENGFLKVDDTLRTTVSHIYGAGDVIGGYQFVYTAAYEGALAAENALTGANRRQDYTALPWVIFTDPQVAGVGLDEKQAKEQGMEADVAVLPLSYVPRSLAARDTRGFIKLIRDKHTDQLIGARILASEGGELLMEVALAIKFGITVTQLISTFHPYLTLSEGIKLAAITFGKDVNKLSCCAS
ncbi:MAG: mercury(II) reductase [Gemmatimonadetes bacterium]|nr:MAG: mercury(II) reductase [Gemmatimonadota bacterium]